MIQTTGAPSAVEDQHSSAKHNATQLKAPVDRRHIWISAPILLAIIGLAGTGMSAVFQERSATLLERNKFEYELIQKALSAPNQKDAAKALKFYSSIGLLSGLAEGELDHATREDGTDLPTFYGSALRDGVITVSQAKAVLSHLSAQNSLLEPKGPIFYTGAVDSTIDIDFQIALMRFQKAMKLDIDGLLGPKTVFAMWDACPACPDLLRRGRTSSTTPVPADH